MLYCTLVFKDCPPELQLYIDSVCSGGGNVDTASEIKDDQVALFSHAAKCSPLSVTRTLEKLVHSRKERIIQLRGSPRTQLGLLVALYVPIMSINLRIGLKFLISRLLNGKRCFIDELVLQK